MSEGSRNYLGLKVGVGFVPEQQLDEVAMPPATCLHYGRKPPLDARGLHRPLASEERDAGTCNTHYARVSSYHHRHHLATFDPSYLVLIVRIGFVPEQ